MSSQNTENEKMEQTEKEVTLPSYATLFFRGFAGFYLLYLVYQMIRNGDGVAPQAVIIIISVIFVIVGIFLLATAIRGFWRGEYIGGKADISNEEDAEQEEEQ